MNKQGLIDYLVDSFYLSEVLPMPTQAGFVVDHLDHGGCKGDLICPTCGRRMCSSCVTSDRPTSRKHEPGHKGECLICSKMYLESEIKLWPTPKDTDEKIAKIKSKIEKGKSYRRIVLT